MKKIFLIIIFIILIALTFFLLKPNQDSTSKEEFVFPTPLSVHFTANFEIYTLGTKRIFTDSKYHNLSPDVYISPAEPNTVHIQAKGVTWNNFFSTLPMKLDKECLTTGTGQKFCTNEKNKLKFFLNEQENPNALDSEIKNKDKLQVIYE